MAGHPEVDVPDGTLELAKVFTGSSISEHARCASQGFRRRRQAIRRQNRDSSCAGRFSSTRAAS